ncbi:hypothetical protein DDB_G0268330 [Dictyostelium discoideum AX4]|uniref:Sphingomyelinase phosphodiesterase D n=1 Tax=Dictyostelium discoideum TaxID=44689 RepID=SGMD_DICDI|nr:hypothetical protein DDB_G0268330 [Dictyostelium discoideum AX4]Q55GC7.1 RecName: Full=Sphingomyelinase phosphodiesterase D; AltName: Full=ASM-like phosphodiesterase D; Flags: Precursor [Dictyostelium discoideum]EAL73618.1 hypothetical protein DDB_G0268330 [Dictyostelium discoideum AX4]|eukprot:XP_647257.1 hypothetical protein DDB_G0268330 [Dictyostelium discoideum AX4]
MKIILILVLVLVVSINALNNQFLHISDVHYSSAMNSLLYNASVMCIGPTVTKEFDHKEHEDLIEDTERLNLPTNGLYGRYGCDTNQLLLSEVISEMLNVNSNPDFIIYTGDGAGHGLPNGPWSESQSTLAKSLYGAYPNTQFIPTIGNNDVFPDYNSQCNDSNLQFLYETWAQWIPTNQVSSFLYRGSFVVSPVSGLTIISLNTILYSVKNKNTFSTPQDPCGQFAWLEQQLIAAKQAGNSVYIIGHIFPGLDPFYLQGTWKSQYQTAFFNITSDYQTTITAGFFGHIHRDEIRSIQFDNPSLTNNHYFPMFIGSSITPVYFNNPTFKQFTYDSQSKNITDITAYFSDVYISNLKGHMNWTEEYDFVSIYDIDNQYGIGGDQLNSLMERMVSSNSIFNNYDNFRSGSYLSDSPSMTCLINAATIDELNACTYIAANVA